MILVIASPLRATRAFPLSRAGPTEKRPVRLSDAAPSQIRRPGAQRIDTALLDASPEPSSDRSMLGASARRPWGREASVRREARSNLVEKSLFAKVLSFQSRRGPFFPNHLNLSTSSTYRPLSRVRRHLPFLSCFFILVVDSFIGLPVSSLFRSVQ